MAFAAQIPVHHGQRSLLVETKGAAYWRWKMIAFGAEALATAALSEKFFVTVAGADRHFAMLQ
jgi:hypothetical protein